MSYLSVDGQNLVQDVSKAAVLWFSINARSSQQTDEIVLKEGRLRADGQLRHPVLKTR